jgi:hypothetical protein
MSVSAAISRLAAQGRGRRAVGGALAALVLAALCVGTLTAVAVAQDQPAAPAAPAPAAPAEPAPVTPPKDDQSKSGSPAPENVKPLPPIEGTSVMGKKVRGPNGEDLGLVVDVLVDPDGQPHAAVIDFGGFLGVGSRKIAIDWKALDFTSLARANTIELGLDRAQIAAAPEYKSGPSGATVVTAPPAPAPPVDPHK